MPGNNGASLSRAANAPGKKFLLLHVCCGPCAIMPTVRLQDEGFSVTHWFMNPNIHPLTEYLRRREAAALCAERLGVDIEYGDSAWDITAWLRGAADRDTASARCVYCCESRLAATFSRARQTGFAYVSTSLLYSCMQPHEAVAATGEGMGEEYSQNPVFVYRDFRKDWQEGIVRSKTLELYRQPYCGCIYSEAKRYSRRLSRLCV